jgi:hypothetical protein
LTRDFADDAALYVPATAGGRCNDEPAEARAEHGGHRLSHAHDWEAAIAAMSFVPDDVVAQLRDLA